MSLLNADCIVHAVLRLVNAEGEATFAELDRGPASTRAGNGTAASLLRAVRQGDPVGGRERERNHRHVALI